MKHIALPCKIKYLLWHLWLTLEFFVIAICIKALIHDPIKRRRYFIRNNCRAARRYLKAFQIKTNIFNPERLALLKKKNYLIVANHVSYTDIMVIGSLDPVVFITSVEMGSSPFLGDITRLGGSLFTDRKKHVSLPEEILRFSETAKQGFSIVLFAEGTSTDGTAIRPFRSSLFQISGLAELDILPICVKYTTIDGEPRSNENKDTICWYGDMTFAPHFWTLLGRKITTEIHVLEPIPCSTRMRRQDLADLTYERINEIYSK